MAGEGKEPTLDCSKQCSDFLGIRRERAFSTFLRGFLAFTVLASGWAFLPGRIDGQVAFVLYREPKFAAALTLVWWFLALFLLLHRDRLDASALSASLRDRPIQLLALLLLLFALATLWAEVPANGLFELSLYLPLFMLVIALIIWMRSDTRVRSVIELSLITSAAVATAIGGLQWLFEPEWLTAINPLAEVGYPSVMGYKNPMALAIGGQIFLLFGWITPKRSSRGISGWRLLLILCALAELGYLAWLESRTSLGAFAVAIGVLLLVAVVWPPRRLPWRRLATIVTLAALLLGLGVAAVPAAREKGLSLLTYVIHPVAYLESDRGVYLRNTLNMVRHRPWGVGTGDWQTQYPVYRLHDRYRSFDETYEVRRAHSDHVQILGENGWLGFAVWIAFLGAVLWKLASVYRGSREPADLFLLGQIVFWVTAMTTDYVLDLPFHRLAFFLLIACAVAGKVHLSDVEASDGGRETIGFPLWARNVSVAMTLGAALLTTVMATRALRLAHDSAVMTRHYLLALDRRGTERSKLHHRAAFHGETLLATAVHSKTRFKDWQVLADVFRRLGNKDAARRCAMRALELHPYSPKTFRLLARLTSGDEQRRWQEGYEHIVDQATAGYRLPHPGL